MKAILKSVSRSFYLTISFLPRPLREPVSLAYLLARATDTIADTATVPAAIRLTTLRDFARVIAGELDFNAVAEALQDFAAQQSDPHERTLIENLRECIEWLAKLDPADRDDIRGVLKTIVTGQELDLQRFGDPAVVTSLRTGAELEEYTYLVAGCVGDFWTKLGFRHIGTFASRSPEEMTKLGIDYGKGLQLINVLRDRGGGRRGGSRLFAGRGIGDCAGRASFRKLARQGGRENHRRHRLLFGPNELASSFCDCTAGADWRADDRAAARGRGRGKENQGPAKRSAPHPGRRCTGIVVAGCAARAVPAPARADPQARRAACSVAQASQAVKLSGAKPSCACLHPESWKLAPASPTVANMRRLQTFLALVALSGAFALSAVARPTALVGGRLIDGFGGPPLANSVILIDNERITAIGQVGTLAVPKDAEVISTEGMDILPGLWDCHVHTMLLGHSDYTHWDKTYPQRLGTEIMPAAAHQLLMAGVTSARDLGAPLKESIEVRDRINRGEIPGPTLYVAGPFIQHEPYPGTEAFRWGVKGAADGRAKVKKLADAGVNIIKLIDQDEMTMEEVKAVVDEAHAHKLPVVAHAHRPEEIRRGLAAGVDDFEHTGLSTAPGYPDDILKAIAERTAKMNIGPLFWCPTIEGFLNYGRLIENPESLDDPAWKLDVPNDIVEDIKASIRHPGQLSYYQITPLRAATVKKKFHQLQDAGVVLLIGTDSGIPMKFHSSSTWHEMDAWVHDLGVDPMATIRAATYWPAVMMKVDKDYGSVSEGKFADIIAVKGDVLRYIDLLQRVDLVIKHGHRYK